MSGQGTFSFGDEVVSTAYPALPGLVVQQSQAVTLANIQAKGAVLTGTFNVGAVLPTNARLLAAEISTTQAFAGIGFVSATGSIQGGSDAAGTIVAAVGIATVAVKALAGTNPYQSRAAQQITVTLTLVGVNLVALTAGAFTVNVYYAQTP